MLFLQIMVAMPTERQRYLNWLDAQMKDHGLEDVRICTGDASSPGDVLDADALRFGDHDESLYRTIKTRRISISYRAPIAPETSGLKLPTGVSHGPHARRFPRIPQHSRFATAPHASQHGARVAICARKPDAYTRPP